MKILTRKNGVALIAVLTVLLVLTLLLPVMFRTSENATYSSVTELSRQKAGYLARTGAEMAVATLKGTLKDTSYEAFYDALKNENKTENATYGITKNGDYLSVKMAPISLYQKTDSDGEVIDSKYISGEPTVDDNLDGFNYVGKTEITVTYNGDPQYFKIDETTGQYEEVEKSEAYENVKIHVADEVGNDITVEEIKEDYVAVYNDNFMVKSTATVNGQKITRSAAVIETVNMLDEEDEESFIAYTGQTWAEAPEFIQKIKGDYPTPYEWDGDKLLGVIPTGDGEWVVNYDKKYDGMGGNQVMINPFRATSKKTIKAFGAGLNGVTLEDGYYNKDVYIFSAIGNMHINLPEAGETVLVKDFDGDSGGDFNHYYALGAYPGINWRVAENPNASNNPSLQAVNYASSVADVQRYNFTSFCATDTLQVSLPVELRVNPKRTYRWGDGTDASCTLFKVMNFQAKDIVFEERIDLFASICIEEFNYGIGTKSTPDDMCYRGGFLNLTAPANTPYSYYNEGRKETVSAGIVYFTEPVYLWFQDTDALGANTINGGHGYGLAGSSTMYRVPLINNSTKFDLLYDFKSENVYDVYEVDDAYDDLKVFKLFEAGDVYYFNAEVLGELDGEEVNMGVNLVNWFLETKYINAREDQQNFWDYLLDFKTSLYFTYLKNQLENNQTYVLDDMHYIGNMNKNPTLTSPDIEDDLYVVWDN